MLIRSNHKTTDWSGGKTTELFIFPEDSSYKANNYNFRLSTATVEIEKSTFTPLPGVERTLLVLEGQMDLIHQDHHSSSLSPLEQDRFNGGWNTSSKGRCIDFNLMCRNGSKGSLKAHSMTKNSLLNLSLSGKMNFIYVHEGSIEISGQNLTSGNLLILGESVNSLDILANHQSTFVAVEIEKLI